MRRYVIVTATEVILDDSSNEDDAWSWYKECPGGYKNTVRIIDEKIVSNDYVESIDLVPPYAIQS